ncbi:hydantoinase B/oxoprolinase family protein [Actinoallomurus soli]|uniref:hydantoinase B/oxoprolinase family protein n=1 Tax=Actinoallomurus soli TaxID=2952535 RepID=UPI002092DFDE|nr:hydantoinase B/oxoprolinase family protein [Actinoallomurus soli]MCO5970603.1 hydantoinase B/oxoprolinase family protein [Actinoallomurus soli]
MTTDGFDPIKLEVWWSRLVSVTDEAATTLLRTAFSTIIRESNDYTVVLMNRSGRTIAECRAGIPAFAALMSVLTGRLLERFPVETWCDGDIVITNDPWIGTGHLPDIAMVTPIFHGGVLVGFTGTAAHVPDIGGNPGMGVTDLMSEGLLIPPMHLQRAGTRNDALITLLLSNVRLSGQVWGDLEAQMAANDVCRRRAVEFLRDTDQADFAALSTAVHTTADRGMRRAIAAIPDGTYRSVTEADGVLGQPTHIECAVTVRGEDMVVDYTGSSPQVDYAINCTLNYTTAYSIYPLKILLDPFTRSNHGSYRSIRVTAPEGSILNPVFPAPVLARHLTGHLLSCAVYRALADVLPDRVIADSGGAPALRVQFSGRTPTGEPFALLLFASAGMGAGAAHDGLPTTAFPTNSGGGSIEALESSAPLLFEKKEFRADSGGAGTHRGGLGQDIEVRNTTDAPLRVVLLGDRSEHPALGVNGGLPGAVARVVDDEGAVRALKSVSVVRPGGGLTISFAGGGGYGPPAGRDRAAIAADLREGFITQEAAIRDYGTDAVIRAERPVPET